MMTTTHPAARLIILLAASALFACSQKTPEPTADAGTTESTDDAPPPMSMYEAAVANAARPDADRERDAARKPADVLEFIGVQPGMTVLDLFTGGGYYAEIIAHIVGGEGRVIAQTNEAYMNFGSIGETFNDRFGNDRLPNVETLLAENNELSLDPDSIDVAMLVLSFHDLYLVDDENGWPAIDVDAFLAELRRGLRPGGTVAIIDHTGAAGVAPEESGNTLHRIDPAAVVATMERAGFTLDGESDILANPDDDLTQMVFADGIRGQTDRFIMTFTSPD